MIRGVGQKLCLGDGTVKVLAWMEGNWEEITLSKVKYIPGGPNLFSENVATDLGYDIKKNCFGSEFYVVTSARRPSIWAMRRPDRLHVMIFRRPQSTAHVAVSSNDLLL